MDAHGPGDGDVDEWLEPFLVVDPVAFGFQSVPAHNQVEKQVTEKHHGIPEEHAVGRRVEEYIEAAHGLTKVDQNEGHAHDQGGDGQKFSHDRNATIGLVVVQVIGQDHHHAAGGHPDEIGEVGDVKPPGDVPAHSRDAQPHLQLPQIKQKGRADAAEKDHNPHPIRFTSF